MPFLPKLLVMLFNEPFNFVKLVVFETSILSYCNRLKPKIYSLSISFHMDMWWFTFIRTKKYKTVWAIL